MSQFHNQTCWVIRLIIAFICIPELRPPSFGNSFCGEATNVEKTSLRRDRKTSATRQLDKTCLWPLQTIGPPTEICNLKKGTWKVTSSGIFMHFWGNVDEITMQILPEMENTHSAAKSEAETWGKPEILWFHQPDGFLTLETKILPCNPKNRERAVGNIEILGKTSSNSHFSAPKSQFSFCISVVGALEKGSAAPGRQPILYVGSGHSNKRKNVV